MILVMQPGATPEQIDRAEERLRALGFDVHRSAGELQTILGAVGQARGEVDPRDLQLLPGVREVLRIAQPFKLVNRMFHPEGTVVDVDGVRIGGDELVVIAGPCAVESREQMLRAAAAVRAAGGQILRGGAFKPRSSPYSFQGLGEAGLALLREAADSQGLPCVTEVVDTSDVALVARYADMLQVGTRNMQNFRLLGALGATDTPVLLKRGMAATLEELLMSAEYIAAAGNPRIVLCERGVRTFEPRTRNTMDLSAIPVLRELTHLPLVADPSHATGVRQYVIPMARAAVAAGADGVMIEMHPEPECARCDGAQSLTPPLLDALMADLRIISPAVRRRLSGPARELRRRLDAPLYPRVVILGCGLLGGSLGLALKEAGAAEHIVGVDLEAQLDAVAAAGVVDEAVPPTGAAAACAGADLVVLATPVAGILEWLEQLGAQLTPGTLVVDVGSTKAEICRVAAALPAGVHFVGTHPMAGSERRGAAAADPLLFHEAAWVLCPVGEIPADVRARLERLLAAIGAHPLELEPARHDRLAAAVSHVPHLVAAALANSLGRLGADDPLAPRLAAGGFRAVTRTASSPSALWRDILETNRGPIHERLQAFREALDGLEAALEDPAGLDRELSEAAAHRLGVPRDLIGVHRTATELVVRVLDEPGALAAVTTALARERINIRDLQILKVRQDEDGVLRLAFTSPDETARAAEVLRRAGHDVRERDQD